MTHQRHQMSGGKEQQGGLGGCETRLGGEVLGSSVGAARRAPCSTPGMLQQGAELGAARQAGGRAGRSCLSFPNGTAWVMPGCGAARLLGKQS